MHHHQKGDTRGDDRRTFTSSKEASITWADLKLRQNKPFRSFIILFTF